MKVLIISHNPISKHQNMGKTLMSIFSSFEKEELCQLYIYPSLPDGDYCNSFLRITDSDALRGFFSRRVKSNVVNSFTPTKSLPSIYQSKNNNSFLKLLLRDFVWLLSPWFNKKVKKWILNEKPTHIFLAPGSSKFIYRMALRISKYFSLPLITYFCDDFYFQKTPNSLFGRIWHRKLKRITRKTITNSWFIINICETMFKLYKDSFSCEGFTLMTGSSYQPKSTIFCKRTITSLTYMGNIGLNRYKSLIEVGKALEKLNACREDECFLDIYSKIVSREVSDELSSISSIRLHEYVVGEEYKKVFFSADSFIHVESLNPLDLERIKYSVSTKIADILASGIPLFSYGPEGVASINHLKANKCAAIVTSSNDLLIGLASFLDDLELRKKVSTQGLITARSYHNSFENSLQLKKRIITGKTYVF